MQTGNGPTRASFNAEKKFGNFDVTFKLLKFMQVVQYFQSLSCFCFSNHAKQNIKKELKDLVGDIEVRKTVYRAILGKDLQLV